VTTTNRPRWGIAWAFASRQRVQQRLTVARLVLYVITLALGVSAFGVIAVDEGLVQ
jgi:hypothetical protein